MSGLELDLSDALVSGEYPIDCSFRPPATKRTTQFHVLWGSLQKASCRWDLTVTFPSYGTWPRLVRCTWILLSVWRRLLLSVPYCRWFGVSGYLQYAGPLASLQCWNTSWSIPFKFWMGWLNIGLPDNVRLSRIVGPGLILLLICWDVSDRLSPIRCVIELHWRCIVARVRSLLKSCRWPLFLEDWLFLNSDCM